MQGGMRALSRRGQLNAQAAARPRSCIRLAPVRQRHAVVAAAAAAGQSTADLQELLTRKEAQLAQMFESGRPMPKAAEVAALRSEISALSDQLAGRPVKPLVAPGGHDIPMGAVSAPGAPLRARSRTEQLAFKAYEMVEEQLRHNQGMGNSEDMEVAHLEAENIALRAHAFDLLKRQQQLETLLAEVKGAKPPELLLETTEDLLARMKAKLQRS